MRAGTFSAQICGKHGQSLVLIGFHDLALTRPFVIDTAEMQDAMNDDAVQLIIVGLAKLLGIAAHRVQRDDNVTIDDVTLIIVKCDDVGVVVMAKILVVDFKNLLVADKHIAYLSYPTAVGGCDSLDPCRGRTVIELWHLYAV